MEVPSWDDVFMSIAYVVAAKSKDRSSHIGAVVVGPKKEFRTMGFNGLPRGADDDIPERQERPEKYFWFEHAERNAIYNATLIGASLENCKAYVTLYPCMNCARALVQSGVKEVIVDVEDLDERNMERWGEEQKRARQLFKECGVKVRKYEGNYVDFCRFMDGKRTELRK